MQMRVWPKGRSARRLKEAGGVSATSFSISAVTKAPGASQPLSARARRAGSARFFSVGQVHEDKVKTFGRLAF